MASLKHSETRRRRTVPIPREWIEPVPFRITQLTYAEAMLITGLTKSKVSTRDCLDVGCERIKKRNFISYLESRVSLLHTLTHFKCHLSYYFVRF